MNDEVVASKKERDMYRCVVQALSQGCLTGVEYRPGSLMGSHTLTVFLDDYTQNRGAVVVAPETDNIEEIVRLKNERLYGTVEDDKDIEIVGLRKQLAEAEGQRDRLNVQLAGCLAVAEGHVDSPCEPRAYGWSPAYEKTLWLQREVTELRAGHLLRERVAGFVEDLGKLRERVAGLPCQPRCVLTKNSKPQTTYHGGFYAAPCDAPGGTDSPPPQGADKGTGSPPPRQPGSVCESK